MTMGVSQSIYSSSIPGADRDASHDETPPDDTARAAVDEEGEAHQPNNSGRNTTGSPVGYGGGEEVPEQSEASTPPVATTNSDAGSDSVENNEGTPESSSIEGTGDQTGAQQGENRNLGDGDGHDEEEAARDTTVVDNHDDNVSHDVSWRDYWFVPAVILALVAPFAVLIPLLVVGRQTSDETCPTPPPTPDDSFQENQDLSSLDPAEVGRWETVIPEENGAARFDQLGMHSVHAILLPSGKVLLTPGSGWRNDKKKTDVFDPTMEDNKKFHELKFHVGLYNRAEDPFDLSNMAKYYKTVNNCATYDPASNEFFRVPHPVPVNDTSPNNRGRFVPTDLFCTGHLQLPNGNAMFIGGTQFYLPHFSGHHATYIYDWVHDAERDWTMFDWTKMPENQTTDAENSDTPWFFAGLMERGRWYPSIVPLMDGRFVIIGGFVDFKNLSTAGDGDMYPFEVNQLIEFFDYRRFDGVNMSAPWRHIDVSRLKDSPFQTRLPLEDRTEAADCSLCNDGGTNCFRKCEAYKNDTFKLYPRVALMPDGRRIFFTRDGDFNSMRDPDAMHMRNTKFTYLMDIGTNPDQPQISFSQGPPLPRHTLNAGSVIRDPNNNMRLLVSGGMNNSGGFYSPGFIEAHDERTNISNKAKFDITLANHYLGGRGSRGVLIYNMPPDEKGIGSWDDEHPSFLGPSANSERTMHYKVILPNRQVLVVGGGNYWFANSVRNPVLYTHSRSNSDKDGYDAGKLMAPQIGERLYHNTALLLADGRVFMAGGNPNRASFDEDQPIASPRTNFTAGQQKFNPKSVERDLYFLADGYIARGHKPSLAEEWTAEIYSPPYMFIDGSRRTVIDEVKLKSNPGKPIISFFDLIKGKRHYLFHTNITVELKLANLPDQDVCAIKDSYLTLVKLGASTHGWDGGQQLFDIPITSATQETASTGSLEFKVPDSQALQIVPAFYHLFYVDCRGKPTVAESIRFDDNVDSVLLPRDRADPSS